MPKSNYPGGFKGGLTVQNLPIDVSNPGQTFWVNNSSTLAKGGVAGSNVTAGAGSYRTPFASVDYANGRCVAGRGDVIYVMPNHSETISAADGIDFDVAGVTIRGLGRGASMPKFDFTAAAGTVAIDAANVSISGIDFHANVTVVAKGLDIKDGADDFHISNCRFTTETLADDEFEDSIFVTTSDRGIIEDCYFDMDTGADADSAIHLFGVCLGATIRNNYITGSYTVACIESENAAQEQVVIENNTLINGVHAGLGSVACISLLTATSGVIQNNNLYTAVSAAVTAAIVADGCFQSNNRVATTAEAADLETERVTGQVIEVTMVDGVEDEAVSIFNIDGTVGIQALYGICTIDGNGSEAVDLTTEATSTPASHPIWAASEIHTANTGDIISSTTVGGAVTVSASAAQEGLVSWNSPLIITGAESKIDIATPGSGAGVHTYICVWEPLSAGAEVLSEKA